MSPFSAGVCHAWLDPVVQSVLKWPYCPYGPRVRAQDRWELVLESAPTARKISVSSPVGRVSDVMILSDVEHRRVALAVARVVADGLHADLGALCLHDVSVAARGAGRADYLERVHASGCVVF